MRILLVRSFKSEGKHEFTLRRGKDFLLPMNGENTSEKSFDEIFDLFKTDLRNLYEERAKELRQKIADESLNLIQTEQLIDPIFNRLKLLREHAENIGSDFLSVFENVIHKHCNEITKPIRIQIVALFYKRYENALFQQKQSISRVLLSRGEGSHQEPTLRSIESIYNQPRHKYINRLEAAVKRHNLELSTKINIQTEGVYMGNFFAPQHGKVLVKKVLLEECRKECQNRKLPKGQTIRREIKYQIAQAIKIDNLGTLETFKSGNSAYHLISKMLSEHGYCRKAASKFSE